MKAQELQTQLAKAQATVRTLQEELAETNRGLVALTMELEQRVEERTADLRVAHAELKKTNSELMQLTLELEDRVAQRTAELAEANVNLRENEDKFRYVFDHSLIGKSITLPTGEMQVNKALSEMLGWPQNEFLKLKWQEITHPDDIEASQRIIDSITSGERSTARFTIRYLHKNGSIVWADVSTTLRRDRDGKPLFLMTAVSDITERKRAEQEVINLNAELEQRVRERTAELELVNKELESFAYSVSHDLRAPLRGIDGWSQALVEDYRDKLDAQGRDYLGRVCTEAQRMGQLIDDLLQLSRTTRAEMRRERVDLSGLARAILSDLSQHDELRQVRTVVAPNLSATGDPQLLCLVLENLLGNAWKFTAKRGQAEIELGVASHEPQGTNGEKEPTVASTSTIFFIRDNGAGFDMAHATKLFGPFQRLHRLSEFPGTGVGLATVQRIIHRHGGRIWAEAERDKGATFYFTL